MGKVWLWAAILFASALSLGVLWLSHVPLGIPGEWTWLRHEVTPDLWGNLLLGLAAGAMYLGFVAGGWRRLARPNCGRVEAVGWLIGLGLLAGGWLWMVAGTGSTGATLGRWPFVLYYPSSSGYFFKARYEARDAREFLHRYEALMRQGDVLHTGTHPPGLFLFYHGLIRLTKLAPAIVAPINATEPAAVRESFGIIQEHAFEAIRQQKPANPLTSDDRAVIWLSGLICFAMAAGAVWPLYGFLRQDADRATSWICAAAWPLVPAIAIFLPKSDVAYACLAMTMAWAWRMAWREGSFGWSALAGGIWAIGLLCSLAFLPVALWVAVWSGFRAWQDSRGERKADELLRIGRTVIPAALMAATILAVVSYWGDVSLPKVYWLNYQNHAAFYAQFPRTYAAWLAVNPTEFAFATGMPIAFIAAAGCGQALRDRPDLPASRLLPCCAATLIVWLWLWLSGKNSGEAARLWIFLMPWLVCCCAAYWSMPPDSTEAPRSVRWPLVWLSVQAALCLLTVQRVNGFPLQ